MIFPHKYAKFIIIAIILCIILLLFLLYMHVQNIEYYKNSSMKIYLHKFGWDTDITNNFFIDICSTAFNTQCTLGNAENSDIIVFNNFADDFEVLNKYKYKIFFTGENHKTENPDLYDVLFAGENTAEKYVSFPLFLLYLDQNAINNLINMPIRTTFPDKDILVIISNPGGGIRNKFIDALDKEFNITYAGGYKNNIGGKLEFTQGTPEYNNYVNQYKFIITMENSEAPHYVTEKILQGMQSQIVPVYYGASEVSKYFNKDRFIQLKDGSDEAIGATIYQMKKLASSPQKWLDMVNKPVFAGPDGKLNYGPTEIGKLMRSVLKISE